MTFMHYLQVEILVQQNLANSIGKLRGGGGEESESQ